MYFTKIPIPGFTFTNYGPATPSMYHLYTKCSRGDASIQRSRTRANAWSWSVNFDVVVKGVKRRINKYGQSDNLAAAARQVLKRLLSQRTDRLYELMRILANDQAMFELAQIGSGPAPKRR
jgi:hypothetical protein